MTWSAARMPSPRLRSVVGQEQIVAAASASIAVSSALMWIACTAVQSGPSSPASPSSATGVLTIFAHTRFVLGDLLRHVHVQRQLFFSCPCSDLSQIIERHRTNAVRGNAESHIGRFGRNFMDQRIHVGEKVGRDFEESLLAWIVGQLKAGPKVSAAQQNNTDANRLRRRDHFFAQQVRIVVGQAIRCSMQIVKFTYRGRTGERHFKKCHARDVVNLLWLELRGRVVHGSAPGPEILSGDGSRFRLAADQPLKGVRVHVDEAGKQRLSWQIDNHVGRRVR